MSTTKLFHDPWKPRLGSSPLTEKTQACQKDPTTFGNGNLETLKLFTVFSIRCIFRFEAVEETITEVHLCTVDLAERVLPALQKIGASALGFALVSGSGEMDGGENALGLLGLDNCRYILLEDLETNHPRIC